MATFTNQATLRYNGNVVNSNITTGELLEVLSATKTAVIDSYTQGSNVTYVINIVNSSTITFTGISTIPSQITVPAATYTQDQVTGEWLIDPGIAVLTVTGTV
jgi:hypothetical protein